MMNSYDKAAYSVCERINFDNRITEHLNFESTKILALVADDLEFTCLFLCLFPIVGNIKMNPHIASRPGHQQ